MKNALKLFLIILSIIFCFLTLFYFLILPNLVQSNLVINFAKNIVEKQLSFDLEIKKPMLKTSFKPEIIFMTDKISLSNKNDTVFELDDFEFKIDFKNVFKKEIEIKNLNFKKIILNSNKIIEKLPKAQNKPSEKSNFKITFLNSQIKVDEVLLSHLQNGSLINGVVKNIKLQNDNLFFNSRIDVIKNQVNLIKIETKSDNAVKIFKDKILVDNLKISINDSILKINSDINHKELFVNAKSEKFNLSDVFKIINSNLIIPNGEVVLSPLKNPKGSVSFDVKLNNADLSGIIDVNHTGIQIKDVSNLPINISDGKIKISKDKIDFLDLVGYYGKNKTNKIKIIGDIKDYYKTFDSNILVESLITNEFFKDYLSSLINNTELYVSKPSNTKVIYKSKNNIIDLIWFAQIDKGVDFGVTNEKSALSNYDRAVLGEFQIKENKLDIKNINYYIASNIIRGVKLQPIIQVNGLLDLSGQIDRIGFAFGREMPCEFLNVFLGQKMFKKGTIKGNLEVAFKNNVPYLNADMQIKKTLIPTQRVFLKEATLKSANDLIKINALGRFKRANFNFKGAIKNGLVAPFVVKNLTLDLDNVDIERILASFNNQNESSVINIENEEEISDDNFMFDTNLIRIEDCDFTLAKGNYKDLTFGNIKADLTLDEKGILKIKSNRFDIAQGVSSLKVECDLKKLKYYILLGVKGIDSNLMAKTLFNLDKEITGRANGIIELYGDKTLKMNGDVKFLINEGMIGKVGLVEYLMKIASVFRNPIVMVSPATIMDIISIPEGKFDKIEGVIKIKDNVLSMINIKSYSKSLSALIKGRFDMELHDASIRIYTRFSTDKKSMFGILRRISLSSLANKMNVNNNNSNYYASELVDLPQVEVDESKTQIFLTQVEGDIENFNFLSSLKKIK